MGNMVIPSKPLQSQGPQRHFNQNLLLTTSFLVFLLFSFFFCLKSLFVFSEMGAKANLSLLFHVSLFFFLFSSKTHLSMAADRLSPGESLTGNQTITSSGDRFVLGFFTPGNSSNYYIGIWYKKVSIQTVIWVANRETPLPNTSSQLKLTEDGNLVLFNQSNTPIWSSNSTSANPNSTVLVLLDTGNLVLRDGSNSTAEIWQSFDHPTDTWMPTGKVGLNKITGVNQRLVSWRSKDDPAPGPFSLEINPNPTNEYLILWNSTRQYWTSGPWNGQIFSLVPEMRVSYIYNFSFQDDKNGKYFIYSVYDTTILSRFVMDTSGQIKQMTWLDTGKSWNLFWSQPRAQCDVYSLCGAFGSCEEKNQPCNCVQGFQPMSEKDWNLNDWSRGCGRKTKLQCESNSSVNGEKDRFWAMPDMQLPENQLSLPVGSPQECESACLSNCSCNAYAYVSGCLIWNGNLMNLRQLSAGGSSSGTLYLRLAASEFPSSSSKKGVITGAIVGAVAGVAIILAIVLLLIWRCRRRQMIVSMKATEGSLVPFSYRAMQIVTKNFSEKLGGGGFGSVFKGILPDSSAVAVKKLEGLRQGEKQFRTEVSTIGTIQHVNLIRLRGFCSEGSKRLLVYDYMPNGSLDSHLFRDKPETIDWKTRYQIALGTARGLAYLHEKCRDCIVHCDIKPENILLDATLCPKVADFGLAKLIGREFSRVLTTMRGTRGYLAPEWISGLAITAKADVYSYGMMLFEIISGRRNFEQSEEGKIAFFPTWAANKMLEGEFLPLLDPRLEGIAEMEELVKACRVACWCIQDDENDRPSMGLVVQIFEGVLDVNMPPVPRSLQIFVENQNMMLSTESSSAPSSQARSNTSTSTQSKSTLSTSSKGELAGSNPPGCD